MIKKIPLYTIDEDGLDGIFKLYQLKGNIPDKGVLPIAPFPTDLPHIHNFFEIFVFTNGSGKHILDFENYNIRPRSIHVVSPGQAHLIENVDNCHGYILAFNREFHSLYFRQVPELLNHSFFRLNNVSPVMTLRAENFEDLLAIIEKIKEEIQMNKRDSYNMTRTYLNIILLKLNGLFRERITENKTNTTNGLIPEFRILVEEYFMKYHQVRTYADLLNITPAKLNRVCARFTGKNASEFILERVILEAKRHLVFTNMSSKEIAYGLGYDDPSYFSRFFRKKTGYTPTRFRSEY